MNNVECLEKTKDDLFVKTNRIAFVFLCLFLLDCCVTGGGRYFDILGISIRMILGFLCILFSIPTLLKKWKIYVKEPINLMFFCFIIWFLISAIRGLSAGNNRAVWMSDVKGFIYLFLVPISLNCVTTKKRLNTILDIVILGTFIQVILVLGINVLCAIDINSMHRMHDYVMNIKLGTVSIISGSIFRIFMSSSPYVIVSCVIVIYKQLQLEKLNKSYIVLMVCYLNALLFSYTRSLYGSAVITIIVLTIVIAVFHRKEMKKFIKFVLVAGIAFLVVIKAEEVIFEANYVNFALARTLNLNLKISKASTLKNDIIVALNLKDSLQEESKEDSQVSSEKPNSNQNHKNDHATSNDGANKEEAIAKENELQSSYLKQTEVSDDLRAITEKELIALVKASPIIGNGLGACSETRNGADEYFYLDMLARMGVIGLVLYMLPFLVVILKNRNGQTMIFVCMMLPFWIVTAFNPWMNAALGIMWYAMFLAMVKIMNNQHKC